MNLAGNTLIRMDFSAALSGTATCRNLYQTTHLCMAKRSASQIRRPRQACTARATNHQQSSASVAVSPTQLAQTFLNLDRALPIAVGVVAAISWYLWRQMKNSAQMPKSRISGFDGVLETANAQGGREYRMALATTRQAVAVHRAIGFLNSNNTARAMVELRRALHENSVCRLPLLNTQHEATQLQQLYRLHLENTAQPADFATLLQLRTLLDIDFDAAEKLEREVMDQGSAYSI